MSGRGGREKRRKEQRRTAERMRAKAVTDPAVREREAYAQEFASSVYVLALGDADASEDERIPVALAGVTATALEAAPGLAKAIGFPDDEESLTMLASYLTAAFTVVLSSTSQDDVFRWMQQLPQADRIIVPGRA